MPSAPPKTLSGASPMPSVLLRTPLAGLPTLSASIGGRILHVTGKAMGGTAEQAGKLFGSRGFGRDFQAIGTSNAKIIRTLGSAGTHFASALRHVLVVARPFNEWLAKGVERFAKFTERSAAAGRESGRMAKFFERTKEVLKSVWNITKDVAAAFWNIGKIGDRVLGRDLLNSLEKSADRFRKFTESAEGTRKIAFWFHMAEKRLKQFAAASRDLWNIWTDDRLGLGEKIEKTFGRLRLGEALASVISEAIPIMARTAADMAPKVAGAFLEGWWQADLSGKLITAGFFLAQMGVAGAAITAGAAAAGRFVGSFTRRLAGRLRLPRLFAGAAGSGAATAGGEAAGSFLGRLTGRLRNGLRRVGSLISRAFSAGGRVAQAGASAAAEWVGSALGSVRGGARRIRSAVGRAFTAGRQAARAGISAAAEWVGSALGRVGRGAGRIRSAVRRAFSAGRQAARAGVEAAAGWVGSAVGGIRRGSGRVRNALRRAMVRGRFWAGAATDAAAGWVGGVVGGIRNRSERVRNALRRAMVRGRFWIGAATDAAAGWVAHFVGPHGLNSRGRQSRMRRAGQFAGGVIGRGIIAGVVLALPALAGEVVKYIDNLGRRIGGLPGRLISGSVRRRGTGLVRSGFEQGGFMGAFQEGGTAQDMTRRGGVVAGAPMGVAARDRAGNADVGPGEAVLTGSQQRPVQQALAFAKDAGAVAYGSLEELFSKVTTPHWATAAGDYMGDFQRGGLLGRLRGLAGGSRWARLTRSPLVAAILGFMQNAPRGATFGHALRHGLARHPLGGGESPELLGRRLSALQGRFDLTEEEFVRNGALSMPDILRRRRELDVLLGVARSIVVASRFAVQRIIGRGGNPAEARLDLFEAQTQLLGLQRERAALNPANLTRLLMDAAGDGGDRFGEYRQRDYDNLQRAFERSQSALAAFGSSPDIGAGRGSNAFLASMHKGGVVPGTGERPVLAQGGERVMTRDAQAQYGADLEEIEPPVAQPRPRRLTAARQGQADARARS